MAAASDAEVRAAYHAFLRRLQQDFPHFTIREKQTSPLNKAIDIALRIFTFGAQRSYMTWYHTVIGDTLYVPSRWESEPLVERLITLRHERVHLEQRRRYGDFAMTFLYLIPLFPLGLAYGRARIEWEAYAETIRATAQLLGIEEARSAMMRTRIVEQFTGAAYGWMWPFPKTIRRWYDLVLEEIETAHVTASIHAQE